MGNEYQFGSIFPDEKTAKVVHTYIRKLKKDEDIKEKEYQRNIDKQLYYKLNKKISKSRGKSFNEIFFIFPKKIKDYIITSINKKETQILNLLKNGNFENYDVSEKEEKQKKLIK